MKLKLFQVDAFTDKLFGGNPAAVCPLDKWLSDAIMQNIAAENNLAETAFIVKDGDHYQIRWFTPAVEVDLCGHATLAAAHVLFHHLNYTKEEIIFHSHRSGELRVKNSDGNLTLNFPTDTIEKVDIFPELTAGFNLKPKEAYKGKTDYMLVFENEKEITSIEVDFSKVKKVSGRGIIITSKGNSCDFVSRFFAPQCGIDEDPVTGSAHTTLTPYWAKVFGKNKLSALQLSSRKGNLQCELKGERVEISGHAVTYLSGEIEI